MNYLYLILLISDIPYKIQGVNDPRLVGIELPKLVLIHLRDQVPSEDAFAAHGWDPLMSLVEESYFLRFSNLTSYRVAG